MVVWEDGFEVSGRIFDPAGAALGPAFKVSSTVAYDEDNPDVAAQSNGFVVTWASGSPTGTPYSTPAGATSFPVGSGVVRSSPVDCAITTTSASTSATSTPAPIH